MFLASMQRHWTTKRDQRPCRCDFFVFFIWASCKVRHLQQPQQWKAGQKPHGSIRHAANAAILKFRVGKDWKSAALGEDSNAKHICCCPRQIQRSRFGQGVERRLPAGSSLFVDKLFITGLAAALLSFCSLPCHHARNC